MKKVFRLGHVKGIQCPKCGTPMNLSSSVDDVFVFVWYCSCGHYMDHETETKPVDYLPKKDQKWAMRWDWGS